MGERSSNIINRDDKVIGTSMKIRLFPLVADKASGCTITDVDGKEYLDFSANWAVANIGYGNPDIIKAISEQVQKNSFASFATTITEPTVELAENLVDKLQTNYDKKVWFGLSGSDANDCIFKLVPLATGRRRFISYFGSYHGQTMGSLTLSGHTAQAKFIGSGAVTKIPYPYCYRCLFRKECESCNLMCLDYLENEVFTYLSPPEDTGAIIIEAIQCDGGVIPAPINYLQRLREICDKHNIYLIFDEVKIGIGRTGKFFGFEYAEIEPDAVIFGKPIASGMPLSGVVGRSNILDAGVATHLLTTAGNPVSATAGIATLEVIEKGNLMANAIDVGKYMKDKLESLKDRYQIVGDVRGKGLVVGLEIVKDKKTKEPAPRETAKITFQAFQNGLIIPYVGVYSNVLEFTPPLILNKAQVDEGIAKLESAIDDVEKGKISEKDIERFTGW